MNVRQIRKAIAAIAKQNDDPESQHGDEDNLLAEVLWEIANGADNSQELAREVLAVKDLKFPRWYA